MSTTLTQQALDLITAAGAKGMSSGELTLQLDCDFIAALLKPKCDDGTLVFSKERNAVSGCQMNRYRLAVHAGEAVSTESNGHDLLAAKPPAVKIPVLADVKPQAGGPNVRGGTKRPAPIDTARAAAPAAPPPPAEIPAEPEPAAPFVGAIEKGIPIPMRNTQSALRDQLRKLEPGDSFLTRYTKQAIYHAVHATGTRIVTRTESEGQIRVWRKPE